MNKKEKTHHGKTLAMTFKNAEGGKKLLNVINPKEDLSKQEVDEAIYISKLITYDAQKA